MTSDAGVVLRAASVDDVGPLTRLMRRSWLVAWAPELPFEAVQAFAAADPARPHIEITWPHLVVATCGHTLLGMVHTAGDRIEDLHVDPAFWGIGIGTILLHAAEHRIAQAHPVSTLEVRAFNTRARAF